MAITRRNFPGKDQAWLEQHLGWTLEEIATGKVNGKWNSSDQGGEFAVDTNLPASVRRDLLLNDLSIVNPGKYPPRDTVRIKRTVPRYF